MKLRSVLTVLACLALVLSMVAMRNSTQRLRALESRQALAHATTTPASAAAGTDTSAPQDVALQEPAPEELLRLRAEVTRLTALKGELKKGGHVHAAAQGITRGPAEVVPMPPGYIRKSTAAFVGYSTPENTMQSMLWAIHAKDIERVLQAFDPAMRQGMRRVIEQQGEDSFFREARDIPGMFIKEKKDLEGGMMELKIEVMPGLSNALPSSLKMRQENGEWKIASPP